MLSFPQVNKITFYLTAKTVSSVETSRLAKTGTSFLLNSSIFVIFQDSNIEIYGIKKALSFKLVLGDACFFLDCVVFANHTFL